MLQYDSHGIIFTKTLDVSSRYVNHVTICVSHDITETEMYIIILNRSFEVILFESEDLKTGLKKRINQNLTCLALLRFKAISALLSMAYQILNDSFPSHISR